MAVCPFTTYKPANQFTSGKILDYRFGVLHVNQSNGADLYGWIMSNPTRSGSSQVSCHFQFPKVGAPYQYIDTALAAWCESDGNQYGISFETEGFNTEPLNANQLYWLARVYEWCHATHGIQLVTTEDPNGGRGFIWHGAGGEAWGGHPTCPGDQRKAQRQTILNMIGAPTPTQPQGDEMGYYVFQQPAPGTAQIAAGDDWAVDMPNPAVTAVWLTQPTCLSTTIQKPDQTHWDQMMRRIVVHATANQTLAQASAALETAQLAPLQTLLQEILLKVGTGPSQ